MRRAARTDHNHQEIINALKKVGCTVSDTSAVGGGFPDLVAGIKGINYMIEVKDGNKSPSRRTLTDAQVRFHILWRGHISVVKNIEEAIAVVQSC